MKLAFIVRAAVVVLRRKSFHVKPLASVPFLRQFHLLPSARSQSNKPVWGSKIYKTRKFLKLQTHYMMADPKVEEILAPLRASVKEQVLQYFYFIVSPVTFYVLL